ALSGHEQVANAAPDRTFARPAGGQTGEDIRRVTLQGTARDHLRAARAFVSDAHLDRRVQVIGIPSHVLAVKEKGGKGVMRVSYPGCPILPLSPCFFCTSAVFCS